MKRNFFFAVGLALSLFACDNSHDNMYDPTWVREQYENQWKLHFGEIDPNQNFNMAKQVTANVDLGEFSDLDCKIKVYTTHPLSGNATLLAEKDSKDKQFTFDALSSWKNVYVSVEGDEGLVVSKYCSIDNNIMNLTIQDVQSRSTGITVSGSYKVTDTNWNGTEAITREETFYTLSGVSVSRNVSMKVGDLIPIVGSTSGVFAEGKANSSLYQDILGTGVEYTINKDGGTVTLSMIYGSTSYNNRIGYFYYTAGQDPLSAEVKKYELIADASPKTNLTYNRNQLENNSSLSGLEEAVSAGWRQSSDDVEGTTYRLVYFDENGNSSYGFPAGTKIGFYLYNPREGGGRDLFYSIYDMNKAIGANEYNEWNNGANHCVSAVSYRYGDATYLGFEDDLDLDMNDALFLVSGDFDKPVDVNPNPEPSIELQSWIIACEDLGSIGDYDFNDVVFEVSYINGNGVAYVTPLAGGGTLPAYIYSGKSSYDPLVGEIHELFDVYDITCMINTGVDYEWNGVNNLSGPTIEVDVPYDFSMSDNMGGFYLKIYDGNGVLQTTIGPSEGTAPQMICVPSSWRWPTETVRIDTAYPSFGEWGQGYDPYGEWCSYSVWDFLY